MRHDVGLRRPVPGGLNGKRKDGSIQTCSRKGTWVGR